ncbi:MAG TPA: TonB-dependent receptor [Acidobacteriota bacterium]|nr:TonB-dependent receptor [Acidobacteriota bacterium]
MTKLCRWPCCVLALLVLLVPGYSGAQNLNSIQGKVLDPKGVAIPAATVRLSSAAPGPPLETLTDEDGSFSFVDLPGGAYRLEVDMSGFQKLIREGVDPENEASRKLSLVLQKPQPAPASKPAVNGQHSTRPGSMAGRANGNTPSFREVDLAAMPDAEGMQTASGTEGETAAPRQDNSDVLLISGSSSASVDAGDWSDPAFRERIRQMAESMGFGGFMMGPGGQGPGGAEGGPVPNAIRVGGDRGGFGGGGFGGRAGGPGGGGPMGGGFGGRGMMMRQSRINGSVYSNYQNSFLNANPYSLTGQELSPALQITNTFGAQIGGRLPWGAKGGTTGRGRQQQPGMWFINYEGSRNRSPFSIFSTVPTELERSGDFSQTSLPAGPLAGQPVVLYDPATSQPFAGARIPASRIDPIAAALMKYIPLPNLPGTVQNYTQQRGLMSTSDTISARINSRLTGKDNVFANYSFRRGDSVSSSTFPGLDTDRTNRSQNVGIGGIHRFQPRFMLTYGITFNRVRNLSANPFSFTDDVEGQLGISGVSRDPINFGIPTISFTNYGTLQLGNPYLNHTQTLTFRGGINRIGSKHSFQAGGDVSFNQRNTDTDPNARGIFDFSGFATSAFDSKGHPVAGTGYDFADFLLGLPYQTTRRFGSSNNYLRNKSFNLYFQDNWRARPNLTVNFGLRYEYIQPYYELFNHMVSLDVAPDFTAVAQVFPSQAGPYSGMFPRSLVNGDKNNVGPRIGLAWKRKSTSKWVLRAGYGIFYNPSVYPYIASQLIGQPPFAVNQTLLTTLESPLTLQSGFPADPSVTIKNSYAIDPNYRVGYVQQWNANLQTQLLKLYTLEVGYSGAKGTRLDILRAPNRAPSGISPGSTQDNLGISNAGIFLYQQAGANSILHSGRVQVVRRFSQGFRLQSAYTLSKSIDDTSGVGGGSLVVVQNDRDIDAERSLSSFDQRHRFDNSFSYELPFGDRRKFFAGASPFVQKLIAGWSLNGNYQLYSGTPLTARLLGNVTNNSGTGSSASERPDSTGASPVLSGSSQTTAHFFNTLAFAIPQPGLFGNAGRNTISGPGTNQLNLSMRKSFRLDDNNRRVDLTWQVSNALNHPNWGGVSTVINALNFGQVTSVRPMRQMTFNLRINF